MTSGPRELWACFEEPGSPPPAGALLLSFLPAASEHAWERRYGDRLLRGRVEIDAVRDRARAAYVAAVARLGASPVLAGGRTLRQAMGGNAWWYHPLSMRDSMSPANTTYLDILRAFAIAAAAERHGLDAVCLVGAPPTVARVLAARFRVDERRPPAAPRGGSLARALAARLTFAALSLVSSLTLRGAARAACRRAAAVALQAHWDWSIAREGETIADSIFRDLPGALAARGAPPAWLTWLDGGAAGLPRPRALVDLRRAAAGAAVVPLQGFVGLPEAFRAAFDPRPPLAVARALRSPAFRSLMTTAEGLDLRPLLAPELVSGALGPHIARAALVERATRRACERLSPRAFVACTELFVHSRAMYAGARAGSPGLVCAAAQHASYPADKTFACLDPELDLRGVPDGRPVPAPDTLFAMGGADRRVWLASGFAPERVPVTGGLRYARIAADAAREPPAPTTRRVLLVASLDTAEADLDLVQAAATAAADVPGLELVLVNHPREAAPASSLPGFAPFAGAVEVSAAGLYEELESVALVITACSTAGAETLVGGLPTWQWLWAGPDYTPFLDLSVAPRFTSIADLRDALERFARDPSSFTPTDDARVRLLHERFGPDPARASEAIADALVAAGERLPG